MHAGSVGRPAKAQVGGVRVGFPLGAGRSNSGPLDAKACRQAIPFRERFGGVTRGCAADSACPKSIPAQEETGMKTDGWVKTGGSRSPFSLGMLPFRRVVWPLPAGAQSADAYPHSRWSRAHACCGPRTGPEVYGKVVIELANGPVWAFPPLPQEPTLLIRLVRHPRCRTRSGLEDWSLAMPTARRRASRSRPILAFRGWLGATC